MFVKMQCHPWRCLRSWGARVVAMFRTSVPCCLRSAENILDHITAHGCFLAMGYGMRQVHGNDLYHSRKKRSVLGGIKSSRRLCMMHGACEIGNVLRLRPISGASLVVLRSRFRKKTKCFLRRFFSLN